MLGLGLVLVLDSQSGHSGKEEVRVESDIVYQ